MVGERVLLTGAGGFMGHHTLAHLLKTTDYRFVVTDSFRHRGTSARLRAVMDELPKEWQRVKVVTHDLRTPIDQVTAREIGSINGCINMASESHVDRSIKSPRMFIDNNIALILTMLEWAVDAQPDIFIQVSTDEVYGPALDHAHYEGESHRPSNPYSASKAAQEDIAFAYWRTYEVPLVITNTMNIIGERQDGEKFVPKCIRAAVQGGTVPIHTTPEGASGSRFYLHARNQADALRHILLRYPYPYSEENPTPLQFNVVGEREVSNHEMATLIGQYVKQITGDNWMRLQPIDYHSSRPGHDLRYALDGTELEYSGWKAPLSLEESLERTVKWYCENKDWL